MLTVSFSNDSNHIASGSSDNSVQIYDIIGRKLFLEMKFKCLIMIVKYTKKGLFIVGGRYQNIMIYDSNYKKLNEI